MTYVSHEEHELVWRAAISEVLPLDEILYPLRNDLPMRRCVSSMAHRNVLQVCTMHVYPPASLTYPVMMGTVIMNTKQYLRWGT